MVIKFKLIALVDKLDCDILAGIPCQWLQPFECPDHNCQLCKLIAKTEESVIHTMKVKKVTDGMPHMPFTRRVAWKTTQLEPRSTTYTFPFDPRGKAL